jgi:hypothetical protein
MVASLIATALVGLPAAESAGWVNQLRVILAGTNAIAAEFTRAESRRGGRTHTYEGKLRLARRPADGGWVGDLAVRHEREADSVRYTLWAGKVYETHPATKTVIEYAPADGDPLRMIAEYHLPALFLLADGPTDPRPVARVVRRDANYRYHVVRAPSRQPLLGGGQLPEVSIPYRIEVVTVAVDGFDPPRHLPRMIRATDDAQHEGAMAFDIRSVRLNAMGGPTAADIADPTVLPDGWRFSSMSKAWAESDRLFKEAGKGKK